MARSCVLFLALNIFFSIYFTAGQTQHGSHNWQSGGSSSTAFSTKKMVNPAGKSFQTSPPANNQLKQALGDILTTLSGILSGMNTGTKQSTSVSHQQFKENVHMSTNNKDPRFVNNPVSSSKATVNVHMSTRANEPRFANNPSNANIATENVHMSTRSNDPRTVNNPSAVNVASGNAHMSTRSNDPRTVNNPSAVNVATGNAHMSTRGKDPRLANNPSTASMAEQNVHMSAQNVHMSKQNSDSRFFNNAAQNVHMSRQTIDQGFVNNPPPVNQVTGNVNMAAKNNVQTAVNNAGIVNQATGNVHMSGQNTDPRFVNNHPSTSNVATGNVHTSTRKTNLNVVSNSATSNREITSGTFQTNSATGSPMGRVTFRVTNVQTSSEPLFPSEIQKVPNQNNVGSSNFDHRRASQNSAQDFQVRGRQQHEIKTVTTSNSAVRSNILSGAATSVTNPSPNVASTNNKIQIPQGTSGLQNQNNALLTQRTNNVVKTQNVVAGNANSGASFSNMPQNFPVETSRQSTVSQLNVQGGPTNSVSNANPSASTVPKPSRSGTNPTNQGVPKSITVTNANRANQGAPNAPTVANVNKAHQGVLNAASAGSINPLNSGVPSATSAANSNTGNKVVSKTGMEAKVNTANQVQNTLSAVGTNPANQGVPKTAKVANTNPANQGGGTQTSTVSSFTRRILEKTQVKKTTGTAPPQQNFIPSNLVAVAVQRPAITKSSSAQNQQAMSKNQPQQSQPVSSQGPSQSSQGQHTAFAAPMQNQQKMPQKQATINQPAVPQSKPTGTLPSTKQTQSQTQQATSQTQQTTSQTGQATSKTQKTTSQTGKTTSQTQQTTSKSQQTMSHIQQATSQTQPGMSQNSPTKITKGHGLTPIKCPKYIRTSNRNSKHMLSLYSQKDRCRIECERSRFRTRTPRFLLNNKHKFIYEFADGHRILKMLVYMNCTVEGPRSCEKLPVSTAEDGTKFSIETVPGACSLHVGFKTEPSMKKHLEANLRSSRQQTEIYRAHTVYWMNEQQQRKLAKP